MKQFDAFALDTANECLWKNGAQLALPPKPFAVLRYLVEHPGRLISHDELLDALWPETYVQPQVLRTYMLELRKILGDDAGQPRFIQTLPKRGYCFVAPVSDSQGPNRRQSDLALAPEKSADEIVGRTQELALLKEQLQTAASGKRRVVFVTGDTGIGKSALVDTFCRLASASATVIVGQCVEGVGGKEEYYPLMEMLSHLCASKDGEAACRVLARMAPSWLAALGRFGELPAPPDRTSAQERMPGDVCAALEELASHRPLVLIFEDIHWADPSTLNVISALSRRRAISRLMLVATCRPHESREAARDHTLNGIKHDLLMRRLCVEIPLAPLAKPAVQSLVRRELQQESLPEGLAAYVHEYSEGNPLFVIAIVEHLIAEKVIVRKGSGKAALWERQSAFEELEPSVPAALAQMIELEMERLQPEDQRVLEAASLTSIVFPAWAVAAALQEDPTEIEEACDDLASRLYFVKRVGQDELPDGTSSAFYVFAHGLYREVLYQRQSPARRARRHIRVAEKLGLLFTGREAIVAREMAQHYEAAGQWPQAVRALCLASEHARARQAGAESHLLLEHALRIAANLPETDRKKVESELRNDIVKMLQTATANRNLESDMAAKF